MQVNECTSLSGIYLINLFYADDERGRFVKSFHQETFQKAVGVNFEIKECFYTHSHKNVLRGMHFQVPPHDHHKLVNVVEGQILDVVVDLRPQSSTFLQCKSYELGAGKPSAVFIPKGFAHGFLSLADNSVVNYMVSAMHAPEQDRGIRWDSIDFQWPVKNPLVSPRDQVHPTIDEFKIPKEWSQL